MVGSCFRLRRERQGRGLISRNIDPFFFIFIFFFGVMLGGYDGGWW